MAHELTQQEKLFFSRVAIKIADDGLGFEDACKAVIADDARIHSQVCKLNSYDRGFLEKKLSHRVFANIHKTLAEAA